MANQVFQDISNIFSVMKQEINNRIIYYDWSTIIKLFLFQNIIYIYNLIFMDNFILLHGKNV